MRKNQTFYFRLLTKQWTYSTITAMNIWDRLTFEIRFRYWWKWISNAALSAFIACSLVVKWDQICFKALGWNIFSSAYMEILYKSYIESTYYFTITFHKSKYIHLKYAEGAETFDYTAYFTFFDDTALGLVLLWLSRCLKGVSAC